MSVSGIFFSFGRRASGDIRQGCPRQEEGSAQEKERREEQRGKTCQNKKAQEDRKFAKLPRRFILPTVSARWTSPPIFSPFQDSDVDRDSDRERERDYAENSDSLASDYGSGEKKKKKKHKERKEKKTKKKKKDDGDRDSSQEETTKVI